MKEGVSIFVLVACLIAGAACPSDNHAMPVFTRDVNRRIADVSARGGGRVNVPAGRHLSGTIVLRDNVELHLEPGAEILGVPDHDAYPVFGNGKTVSQKNVHGWCALVYAEGATNVSLTGQGTVDGQGTLQTGRKGADGDRDLDCRARGILFASCRNVTVRGIRLRNAGMWTQHYFDCEDVLVENVEVFSRANHNNDGIDIDSCRRFTMRGCAIDSEDDGVVLKTTSLRPCEDVTVEDCAIASQAVGFKIGTETLGDIRRVRARNLRIFRSGVKAAFNPWKNRWRGINAVSVLSTDGAEVSDVDIDGVSASDQECAILIRTGDRCRPETPGGSRRAPGSIRRVRIANLKSVGTGNYGSSVISYERGRISGVVLENIAVESVGGVGEGDYTTVDEFLTWSNMFPGALSHGWVPAKGVFLYGMDDGSIAVSNLTVVSARPDVRPVVARKRAVAKGELRRHLHVPGSKGLRIGRKLVPYATIRSENGKYRCDLLGGKTEFPSFYRLACALAVRVRDERWAGICLPEALLADDLCQRTREGVQVLHDSGYYAAFWFNGSADENRCRRVGADGFVELTRK